MSLDAEKKESISMEPALWTKIREEYRLPAETRIARLRSSMIEIYQLSLPNGSHRILRFHPPRGDHRLLATQLELLNYVSDHGSVDILKPLKTSKGEFVAVVEAVGNSVSVHVVMYSFIEGRPITECVSESTIRLVGETLGLLDLILRRADSEINPKPSDVLGKWRVDVALRYIVLQIEANFARYNLIPDPLQHKKVLSRILSLAPILAGYCRHISRRLPHQILHGDAHLENLLFDGFRVGVIDFDNFKYAPRIFELAPVLHSLHDIYDGGADSLLDRYRELLLQGYRDHADLTDEEVKSFPLFEAFRLFAGIDWIAGGNEGIEAQQDLIRSISKPLDEVSALLDGYERLLTSFQRLSSRLTIRIETRNLSRFLARKRREILYV